MKDFNINISTFAIPFIQVILFIYILFSFSSNNISFFFLLPLLIIEGLIFFAFYQKKKRYFYLGWNIQLFIYFFYLIVFNFEQTFQTETPDIITVAVFIFLLFFIEAIVLSYLIFKEKSIKKILFTFASSTTFIVFLIVLFVMNEGLPAFMENDPVEVIFGTEWQPFYDISSSDTTTITTIIQPYNHTLGCDENKIFDTINTRRSIELNIQNTGGSIDTYVISSTQPSNVEVTITKKQITLDSYESQTFLATLKSAVQGEYEIKFISTSQGSSVERRIPISFVISTYAVDVSPDKQDILGVETDAALINLPFEISNIGTMDDTYLVSVEASDYFIPNIRGMTWDYSTSSGKVSIKAGETQEFIFRPSMTTYITGIHELIITTTSANNSEVSVQSIYEFEYKQYHYLRIEENIKTIKPGGTATYLLQISDYPNSEIRIILENISKNWKPTVIYNNTEILIGEGYADIILGATGNATVHLQVSPVSAEIGEISSIDVKVTKPGTEPSFGILAFIVGTILVTLIAVIIAAPLGLGCAVFLAEYCPAKIRSVLRPLYELLAGIPSVLYGLWGFLTFGPWISETFYPLITGSIGQVIPFFAETPVMGRAVLTAGIVLSFMILPIILTLSEDSIRSVPRSLKEGSLALGATRWQTMKHIIIPASKSGILSSIILGTGRAIGETMAVLMIMQYFSEIPDSIFGPAGTMTSVIAALLGSTFSFELTRHALFAVGIILFCMIFSLNVIIFLIQRDRKKDKKSKDGIFKKFMPKINLHLSNPFKKLKTLRQEKKLLLKNPDDMNFVVIGPYIHGKKYYEDNNKSSTTEPPSSKTIPFEPNVLSTKIDLRKEKIVKSLLIAGAALVTIFLFFILGDIISQGITSIRPEFIFERETGVGIEGGFANAIVGSLQLVGLALAIAAPLSIGSAVYVQEYAKKDNIFTKIILFTSDTLASTPSIIYGAFGFIFFVWYLRFGLSILAAGFTLGFMIIPIMLRSSIEAIKSVPFDYREGSYALGATKWQTIKNVVLPPASPIIISGTILSIGRAIGETAAVIFTAGYSTHIATSILHPAGNLPYLVYKNYEMSVKYPTLADKVYSAALILIIIVLILNSIARVISYYSSRMMKN